MAFKRIEVYLDEENMAFVKWLAERDNTTVKDELRQIFWDEFDHQKELYFEEMKQETGC